MAENVRKEVEIFFEKMTFPSSVSMFTETDGNVRIAVYTNDARFLIGSGGEMIGHVHALIRRLVQKKFPDAPSFFIDINDYRQKKTELLKEDARQYAKRARLYRKEIILQPMPSFERRIIHSVLSEYPDIATESRGEEPNRSVIIRPIE